MGQDAEFTPPPTPFGGWVKSPRGILVPAETGPHCLGVAPPGMGKTRKWLAVTGALWPSSCLISSSRDDLMQLVMRKRMGAVQLLDLRPIGEAGVYPREVQYVRFDPTKCIKTFQQAAACARSMLRVAGAGQPGGIRAEANGMWDDLALAVLTCLLWTGTVDSRKGIDWVLQAAENPWAPPPDPKTGARDWTDVDPHAPTWAAAADDAHGIDKRFQARVRGVLCQEPRQRDSIKMTISHALTGWLVAGLSKVPAIDFDLAFLDNPENTLFVLCPIGGESAPLASVLMDLLINRRREMAQKWDTLTQLGIFLDELTNTPIANLAGNIAENRGLFVSIAGAMQATSQLEAVYGQSQANPIMDVTPAWLVMYGSHEERLMRSATYWMGKTTSSTHTYSNNSDERTTGREWRDMFDPSELNPTNPNEGRLIVRGTAGHRVHLLDFVESMAHYDEAKRILEAEQERVRRTGSVRNPIPNNGVIPR
ncbi:TraM recognition domain-containing protein [Mycobacteroides salmoniphilum]|uniref:type IV secretory system conjugative DNA transfer family protein n=1 Tax=Mycobacteroides salmoniphilum TaxID=404941 RepID=UPI003567E154